MTNRKDDRDLPAMPPETTNRRSDRERAGAGFKAHRWSGWDRRLTVGAVALLLAAHGILVGSSATRHSPTLNEPGHLVAGLIQWKLGRFDVYRVNPPLVHYLAALPVVVAGYEPFGETSANSIGTRSEMVLGESFVRSNGERSAWLITMARWGCLPFTLVGGLFCFLWSRELWGSSRAGLISLSMWSFEPFLIAHAEVVTTDSAAMSLGLGASFLFWRWLRRPTWRRALAAGSVLGLAELTKTTWVVLYGLWPALWLFWIVTWRGSPSARDERPSTFASACQLATLLALSVYILNLAYLFDGTLTRLGDFAFTSRAFAGEGRPGVAGNRFSRTWLGKVPVPLPRHYLIGIDLQKKDFEDYDRPSFLLGEWKQGGWWYYYLYGLSAKTTLGLQSLVALSLFTILSRRFRDPGPEGTGFRDLVVLWAPGIIVLALVSSQLQFNHHVRYVLPTLGFAIVFAGSVGTWFEPETDLPTCKPA